jgi:pimeloyl-ACP methyl ester carboxylesterase
MALTTRSTVTLVLVSLGLTLAPLSGLAQERAAVKAQAQAVNPLADKPKPWVLHLNGIGGERSIDHSLVRGLREGGLEAEFEIYDWTGDDIGIPALTNVELHKREARRIADIILQQHKTDPRRPIHLTGHSGGAGMLTYALELLPDDVKVESIIMLAPALSPQYDLSRALAHVNGQCYVFTSMFDVAVLSTGTKIFGTIDGIRTEAAGLKGFVQPGKAADPEQYKKLVHFPYEKTWARRYGNLGSHISCMSARFVRSFVAPVLLTGKPPVEAIDEEPEQKEQGGGRLKSLFQKKAPAAPAQDAE